MIRHLLPILRRGAVCFDHDTLRFPVRMARLKTSFSMSLDDMCWPISADRNIRIDDVLRLRLFAVSQQHHAAGPVVKHWGVMVV